MLTANLCCSLHCVWSCTLKENKMNTYMHTGIVRMACIDCICTCIWSAILVYSIDTAWYSTCIRMKPSNAMCSSFISTRTFKMNRKLQIAADFMHFFVWQNDATQCNDFLRAYYVFTTLSFTARAVVHKHQYWCQLFHLLRTQVAVKKRT